MRVHLRRMHTCGSVFQWMGLEYLLGLGLTSQALIARLRASLGIG